MTSVQERLKLKRAPTDIWNIREQLCLASSVLKSGDQNWMSVSRSLKSIVDKDSTRPTDWFSQKSCAQQYAYLLENADIPKRKKRESGETTSEFIVRRLTQDRISELSNSLNNQREEYLQLKNELSLLKNGTISEEKLKKIWLIIEQEEKEQEQKIKIQGEWLSKQQQNKEQLSITPNVQSIQIKNSKNLTQIQEGSEINTKEEDKKNKSGRSSLLTSLLKSPSPITQVQSTTQGIGSPTIASLLCSSPKVPAPVVVQSASPQLHQLVSNINSNAGQDRPSTSAPTLSMLLEQPSANAQNTLQLQNIPVSISCTSLQSPTQVSSIQTRSNKSIQGNVTQLTQVQQAISNSNISSTKIPQMISNPIDEVMPKVIQLDKDEINDMIGDIEELIKEEITSSPQKLDVPSKKIEIADNLNIQMLPSITTEHAEPRNVDEPVSLSNSPISEISIEEIDSSTSNIAEIIGTSIGTVEEKNNLEIKGTQENIEINLSKGDLNKETKCNASEKSKSDSKFAQEFSNKTNSEIKSSQEKIDILIKNEPHIKLEEIYENDNQVDNVLDNNINFQEVNEKIVKIEEPVSKKDSSTKHDKNISVFEDISLERANVILTQEELKESIYKPKKYSQEENVANNFKLENKFVETNLTVAKSNQQDRSELETESSICVSEILTEIVKEVEILAECKSKDQRSVTTNSMNLPRADELIDELIPKKEGEDKDLIENITKEANSIINHEISNNTTEDNIIVPNIEMIIKKEIIINETDDNTDIKEAEYFKDQDVVTIKIEPKKETQGENEDDCKKEKEFVIKKEINNETSKKGNLEFIASIDELDEEESTLSKLSGGRAMKTYSKKQNSTVDSEPENETSGETADYRAWKKSIMLVYNRLSTNRYASIFLRPITEDQAPGYHSIIFRPMDLYTIKKNIDNGTIRSTMHFQRDVMLMFQNAIMFNKHNTRIHKMTLDMQEECLQHMQVLVQATGEGSFRRETRTAASISNETSDSNLKRKWTHVTASPHELESLRIKKRRKSEND